MRCFSEMRFDDASTPRAAFFEEKILQVSAERAGRRVNKLSRFPEEIKRSFCFIPIVGRWLLRPLLHLKAGQASAVAFIT